MEPPDGSPIVSGKEGSTAAFGKQCVRIFQCHTLNLVSAVTAM